MLRQIILGVFLFVILPTQLAAQIGPGLDGPAAPFLNRIFYVGDDWAMYGAPQKATLDRASFNALAQQIRMTRFQAAVNQIIVILEDSDVSGTIGLIDRRGTKAQGWMVGEKNLSPYDIWHAVGYQTSAENLVKDYRQNILTAEELYPNLPVLFTSTVTQVARDEKGALYVALDVKAPYESVTIRAYPWAGALQRVDLKLLKAGDKLKVSGQFTDFKNNNLVLRDCLFSF